MSVGGRIRGEERKERSEGWVNLGMERRRMGGEGRNDGEIVMQWKGTETVDEVGDLDLNIRSKRTIDMYVDRYISAACAP